MPELPTGTVTFLFTDIEGSTRLWEEHPDAMQSALARHDEILRDAVESHAGHVVKTTGDGIHAVYSNAADGIVTAVDAQRQIAQVDWPLPEQLRVRMGLHTGAAEYRDHDYYGPAVNRAARLMSAANGSQILASLATEEVVSEDLPAGIDLIDLGEHRLRDLARPQRIFQVVAPDLPAEFPPIQSIDTFPGNLPSQLTSFVGRDRDLVDLVKTADEARLITLTGAGGMGKTRLAIQLAAELVPRFPDGAWLCELAPANDADAMTQTVAAALGVSARQGLSLDNSIVDFLRPKRLLLVLDNCEHLASDCADLVTAILRACPLVHIVATSRQPLDAPGEQQWNVSSLAVPASTPDADTLLGSDAVQLFLDRARAARRTFAIDDANAGAVAEICRRLDGMPLALELAAARVSSLGPAEIAALLDERFRLLSGGGRDERHQTLRAAIDWSYSLLDQREQRVFDRLGVFPGSFDAEAARAIASDDATDPLHVLDALTQLVDRSMVIAEPLTDGTMRYELLESLRQYALERLGGDGDRTRRRHAEHYGELATAANAGLMSPDELAWRQRIGVELENLRAAVWWGLDSTDDDNALLSARIVTQIGWLGASGKWRIGEWAERAIARGVFPDPGSRCTLYGAAAHAALGWGSYTRACELGREGLLDGLPPDTPVPHMTFNALACATAVIGDIREAMDIFAAGLDAVRSIGAPPADELIIEGSAAMVEAAYGWHDAARARTERALPLARAARHPSALGGVLVAFAWSNLEADPDAALVALDEAIELGRAGATPGTFGIALSMAAELRCRRGEPSTAIAALRETVQVNADSGDRGMLVTALQRSVGVLADIDQLDAAAVFVGALSGPLAGISYLPATEQPHFIAATSRVREGLGGVEYEQWASRGARMSLDELVVHALAELERIQGALDDA